jgi:hypothetical protein
MSIDMSHYPKNNKISENIDISTIVLTALIRCDDNQIRRVSKPIALPNVNYYHYNFESGKDIILERDN